MQQHHALCRITEDFSQTPGDIFLLDNEVFHHSSSVRDFADSIGIGLLLIPPYAP